MVIVVDDRILAADLFSSPALFRQSWPELLEAYAIDAAERAEDPETLDTHPRAREARDVRGWLDGLSEAWREVKQTPGEGDLYGIRSHSLTGAALLWDRGVVHVGLFPAEMQAETPDYNPLEFRRDRLRR